jgi:hypothetical protein
VVSQYLIAGWGQLGTNLLKASQNGEIALINHLAAVTLNIAGTSLLLLRRAAALLLRDGTGGNRYRQQSESEKKLMHRVPLFQS